MDAVGSQMLTILFTDVEGSTAFRTRAGDDAGNRLMAAHERAVSDQVARHDGRLIKSLGDGCLAVFTSPRRAVECAIAVQREQRGAPLRVRVGVNTGEVSPADGDVYGSAVNAAARIAAKAAGGEVLISDIVRQLLGTGGEITLRDRGRLRLRGFEERWRLHEVIWQEESTGATTDRTLPMVGRVAELARMHRVLDNLVAGRGAVVVISGEPGIGKTRLAQETLSVAGGRGWQALTGRCPPFEGGLGLQPIVEAFGGLLRNLDGAERAAMVEDLPQLCRLFEGLGLPVAPPVGDPALERTLLFTAVTRLLERLAARAPLVLLIDDVQWADPASLELLHQLAHVTEDRPVALVLTQRSGERDEGDRVRRLLTALRRGRAFDQVDLSRLDPAAVAQLAAELLGGPPPPGLLDALAPAAGTPLFVDALLRQLVGQGRLVHGGTEWTLQSGDLEVPLAVRDLILERLDALSPAGRRVADLIALTGAVLEHDVLDAAAALDAADLDDALETLMRNGVLVEQVAGGELGYRLAHPLYYEVARDALPELARRRGHAALVRALEARRPGDIDALARHYLSAGAGTAGDRALQVFAAAAQRALDRHGYSEAVRFAEAALVLARTATPPDQVPALLDLLGEAAHAAGRTDAAVAAWTEALASRDPGVDPAGAAATLRALGLAEFDRGRLVEASAHLRVAADLLEATGPSIELADLGFARVTVLRRLGATEEVAVVADQLAAVAAELNTPRAHAEAAYARAAAELDQGRLREALRHALAGLTVISDVGEDAVAYRLHTVCCDAAAMLGDHELGMAHSVAGWELAERLGVGVLAGGAAMWRMFSAQMAGSWTDAWRCLNEYLEIARRSGNERLTASVMGIRVWLLALRGDLDEADALLAELKGRFAGAARADRRGFGFLVRAEARLRLQQDRPGDALAALEGLPEDTLDAFAFAAPVVEARARLGDLAGTQRIVAAMRALDSPLADALAHQALGLVRLAVGEPRAAAADLAAAVRGLDALRAPYLAACARVELARALVDTDRTAAVEYARAASAVFTGLGAQKDLQRARQLLADLGATDGPSRTTARRSGPLSARELEVAVLVAEGLTNAEIADRLTVSVRTVTSHLDHIYARLGVSGRAALARYVTRDEPSALV